MFCANISAFASRSTNIAFIAVAFALARSASRTTSYGAKTHRVVAPPSRRVNSKLALSLVAHARVSVSSVPRTRIVIAVAASSSASVSVSVSAVVAPSRRRRRFARRIVGDDSAASARVARRFRVAASPTTRARIVAVARASGLARARARASTSGDDAPAAARSFIPLDTPSR
jgi:hypothetical protein